MKTVTVRLLHDSSIPSLRWCEPIGWEPKAEVNGEYADGSWWDDNEEVAGLVVLGNYTEGEDEIVTVDIDQIRIASCGDCKIIGKLDS